ncbi:MAG: hypothetical protein U9N80_10970, partial [Chloroflexota bacterium]|nr:hypothetical protein [Chloroflexota bacterium]
MSRAHNDFRFLKLATISFVVVMLIVGCSNRGFNNNNPNLIDGSADFDIDPSVSAGSSGSSSREEMGDQFNETALDDINIIVPESYNQGDPVAEKVEASEGSEQHDESVIGHDYLSESFIGTPVPPIINIPELCIYTSLRNVNCRTSVYVESSLIAILMQGEEAKLLYINPTFS